MKKWIIGSLFFLAILVAGSYLFIPRDFIFRNTISISTNPSGFHRTFFDNTDWSAWWPGENKASTSPNGFPCFSFKGSTYSIVEKRINALVVSISSNTSSTNTLLNIVPVTDDSVQLIWIGKSSVSVNPFKRLKSYFEWKDLQNDMDGILKKIKSYFSNPDNIYGIHIQEALIKDSMVISTYATTNAFPDNRFIYGLLGQLKDHIKKYAAKETDYPILNILPTDSTGYLTRVAIPIDRRLQPSGTISSKWMMAGGPILVTEVKGGMGIIQNAFHQMELYVNDHRRTMPAIPWQALITNRLTEKDTGKWVTRIYFPVR